MNGRVRLKTSVFLLLCGVACSPATAVRSQLLVVIDTDAHLAGELASRPDVSPDAAVDSLRIDVLDTANVAYDTNLFLVPEIANWPVSFGVVAAGTGATVRLRVRAFRARFAEPGTEFGKATLDPPVEVTLDRLVFIPIPASGMATVRVLLSMDCLGIASSFTAPETTCVDTGRPAVAPDEGVESASDTSLPPTRAGTWPYAVERPCHSSPADGTACIPGGFGVLGDYSAVGFAEVPQMEPIPLHAVVVLPFLLDRDEVTVGRARQLVLSGALPKTALEWSSDLVLAAYCTWLGTDVESNDPLPLNCVAASTARQICALVGGTLPSEAQWEYTARGRGQGRRYPWGDDDPTCCALSMSRAPGSSDPVCPGSGPEPVGSHLPSASCAGLGDVTRDGVRDMAGSVGEIVLDSWEPYSAPCWGRGVLLDPVCQVEGAASEMRGGDWTSSFVGALLVERLLSGVGVSAGFRCAYQDLDPSP